MTKVFILLNELGMGGTEHVISYLSNELPQILDTNLVLINDNLRYYPLIQDPIELHYKYSHRIPENINALWKFIPVTIKYILLLKKYKPDVSLSMLDFDNLVNIIACKFTGTKIITGVRQSLSTEDIPFLARRLRYLTTILSKRYAHKIITNSYGTQNELISNYGVDPNKTTVIYNPKDISHIQDIMHEPVSEAFFRTNDTIIITVGRLFEVKGQWHLLRVFAELRKTKSCKLVICGDGPLCDYLISLARDLKIIDDVLFLGFCDNPYKYISISTIFILSSLYEGQPNALIEAMICGCPVISTDCDHGPREILNNGEYGLLSLKLDSKHYSADEPLTYAEMDMLTKINLLLDNPTLRSSLSLKGLERANIFEHKAIIEKYAQEIVACSST